MCEVKRDDGAVDSAWEDAATGAVLGAFEAGVVEDVGARGVAAMFWMR
jgi:hypothetical protein